MIGRCDDLRHVATPEHNFSESKWFSFYDPDLEFWASCRIGLEPNRHSANRWVVAAFQGEVVYHELVVGQPLPDSDWPDISVARLRIRTLVPMSEYRLDFSSPSFSLGVTWQSRTPAFDYKDCVAPLPPSLAAEHYEQSGVVTGSFQYRGTRRSMQGHGHRDHSWGVRHWEGFRSWVAFMAPFGSGSFLHLEQFDEQSSGITRHGFLFHEGRIIPLKDAQIRLEFEPQSKYPSTFLICLEDVHGSRFPFSGNLSLTSPLAFGNCHVGESYGTYRDHEGNQTMGIIEYGFTTQAGLSF